MKISVIIPTYKPQSYLWECLESLINQSFLKADFEILLILNGCNEPYKGYIERYISTKMQLLNVKFIHTEEGGVSNARNIALNEATGDYVTFIDDDDFVSPDYLKELYSKASFNTISLCYPYAFIDGDMKQVNNYVTDEYEKCANKGKQPYLKARKYFSGPWMKLIPMSFIQNRRYDVRLRNGEDSLFIFQISDKFEYVDFTSKDAIYYRRIRKGSAVNNNRTKWQNMKSNILQIKIYLSYFIKSPFKYNWLFLFTRIGGSLYSILTYKISK